jgi:stage V sporulation protein D (sporulation-specific penicillin-binding protein)
MLSKVNINKRVTVLFLLLIAVLSGLNLRMAWIQLVKGSEYQQRALDNRLREIPVEAKRGKILDRNDKELAVSITTPSIGAFPLEVRRSGKAEEIAAKLAPLLELTEDEVLKSITRKEYFWWVKRKVPFNVGAMIKELDLPGIRVVEESQRHYPNSSLASHIIGIAGIDNQGLEGLEWFYDKVLRGTTGYLAIEKDAGGRSIPHAKHSFIPPTDGNTLVLTIDETIQYIVERELDKLFNSPTNPKAATIVVMDPKTGDVLALASRPTFNPNNFAAYPQKNRRNIAVSDVYEPGSTFKIITAAAALEEGVVAEQERFYDPGYIRVGREIINCWRRGRPHGSQSFVEAVLNSCNPAFVTIGLRLEERRKGSFYEYIHGFGFGTPTGLDLSGEAKGLLRPADRLRQINIATISIGQGIAVTPIQLATAMSALMNDGVLMKPRLVKEIRDSEGKVARTFEPKPVRQVVSKETALQMASILEHVVSRGTGRRAYIPGYRAGGKTGTAQKVEGGKYVEGRYIASFLGVAPVNNPRLVCLVIVDEPQGVYYGGVVAAPIFKNVVEDALRYLNVPTQYDPRSERPKTEPQAVEVSVPDVNGMSLERAQAVINAAGLLAQVQGNGPIVINQVPKGAARVKAGTRVIIYAGSGAAGAGSRLVVPDVTGRRISESVILLEAMGLKLLPEGTAGEAVKQHPIPGTIVEQGSAIRVKFQEPPQVVESISP